jgi:glutathione S-transferase
MGNLKLFIAPGTCSLATHIALRELDIDFELVVLNLSQGFPEWYRLINPKLRVPVLEFEDGSILTELPAIMTAISKRKPERNFMGKTDPEQCRVYEWLNWLSGSVHVQGYGPFLRPQRYADDPVHHDALKEKAKQTLMGCFDTIEEKLNGVHAVGDNFTSVDVFLLPLYRWGNSFLALPMKTSYPKYTALVENVVRMGSARDALSAESEYLFGSWLVRDTSTLTDNPLLSLQSLFQKVNLGSKNF